MWYVSKQTDCSSDGKRKSLSLNTRYVNGYHPNGKDGMSKKTLPATITDAIQAGISNVIVPRCGRDIAEIYYLVHSTFRLVRWNER